MKKILSTTLVLFIAVWMCLFVGSVKDSYEAATTPQLDTLIMEEFGIDDDLAGELLDATQVISEKREHELDFPSVGKDYLFGIRQTLTVRDGICMLMDVYFPADIYEKVVSGEVYIGYPELHVDDHLYNEENCKVTAKLVSEEPELFCRTYILTYSGGEFELEPFTSSDIYKDVYVTSSHIYSKDGKDLCDEYGLFSNNGLGWNLYYADMKLSVK